MELAILFWFYKEPYLCKNRLDLLRRYNPGLKIYGLYGGEISKADLYRSKLEPHLDDYYMSPVEDSKWKWINGDLVILDWYEKRGRGLKWDSVVVIQWDNLVMGSIPKEFDGIKKDEIYLFGMRQIDDILESRWAFTQRENEFWRSRYLEYKKYVNDNYGYNDKLWACFFALEVFPRIFFEKYMTVQNKQLGMLEYRVPTYAKIFGIPSCSCKKDLGQDFEIGHNEDGPIRFAKQVNGSFVRRQLGDENGWRIFHPCGYVWITSLPTFFAHYILRARIFLMRCLRKLRKMFVEFISSGKDKTGQR